MTGAPIVIQNARARKKTKAFSAPSGRQTKDLARDAREQANELEQAKTPFVSNQETSIKQLSRKNSQKTYQFGRFFGLQPIEYMEIVVPVDNFF